MRRISLFGFLLLFLAIPGVANAQTIGIMTSPPGAFTHSTGVAIAKVLVEKTGLKATVQPQAQGPLGAVSSAVADFGMASSFELTFAAAGTGEYEGQGPKPDLRVVGTLQVYQVAMHVRKDSDIQTLKDLKGKKVASGFHAQKVIARGIETHLANAGLTYGDVKQVLAPNVTRAAEDFGSGKSDVMYYALGSAVVMETNTKVGGLRVLPVDGSPEAVARMQKFMPGSYVSEAKPAPTVPGITEPILVVSFDNVFATNAKMADEVVYKVVKAIYENKPDLVASFPAFGSFSPQRMAIPIQGLDFHPGALKFYKDVGLLKR
jgi:uncharacterized protein